MKKKVQFIGSMLMVLVMSTACSGEEDSAAPVLVVGEEAEAAVEVEEVEESLEQRLQVFLNMYSAVLEERDHAKRYDMMEDGAGSVSPEDYEEEKVDFIDEAKEVEEYFMQSEGIEGEYKDVVQTKMSMELIEVVDESASYNGEEFIKVLVKMEGEVLVEGERMVKDEILAHMYVMEFDNEHGFVIEDDQEVLGEQ